jgi:hypothetical protein
MDLGPSYKESGPFSAFLNRAMAAAVAAPARSDKRGINLAFGRAP